MFLTKYKNSLLIVLIWAFSVHFLNSYLMPLIQEQSINAGLAYMIIIPLISIFGSIHLLRLIILPFIYLLKVRKKQYEKFYYDEYSSEHEYYQ
ncbi:MAG: hypothetical protein LBV67_00970 [Streptococcaceae bacterium]|jgi:hypothetical protein|nr:hypothetical protein [Streptococcaceae bacterium]